MSGGSNNQNGVLYYLGVGPTSPDMPQYIASYVQANDSLDSNGEVVGYAITSAASSGASAWQYYNGSSWVNISSASESTAVYLGKDTLVRWSGTSSNYTSLKLVAVDNTGLDNTGGTLGVGEVIDVSTRGGTTAFSSQVATLAGAIAPVVFDLDRDGQIEYGQSVMDVNSDGQIDKTAWASPEDGVLVWDKFGNGLVTHHSQYAFTQYGGNTDLEGLRLGFDSNRDGLFDAQDAKFAEFSVWQDANGNGVSDMGELRSLVDLGVKAIQLNSDGVVRNPAEGVTEAGRTVVEMEDGSTLAASDATFTFTTLPELDLDAVIQAGLANMADGQVQMLKLTATDLLQLSALADGMRQLKVLGDSTDVVTLEQLTANGQQGTWSQHGTVTQDGQQFNVYQNSADPLLQVLIDQQIVTSNVLTG